MRPRIRNACHTGVCNGCNSGPEEDKAARDQDDQRSHFYFKCLDFFAYILRCPTDHESGDKYGHNDKGEHAVQTGADAAENDLAKLYHHHWYQTSQRTERIMHRVDRDV